MLLLSLVTYYSCLSTGLIVASVMVDVTHLAQPALLYLVPGVLIPLVIKAFLQVCVDVISLNLTLVSLL